MSVTDNNVLPAGYRKKADTNGTMDIKRFSDSYSVLAVNEPGGERIWKRKQMLKIQCRKRTLDFKIPVVCIPCNRCAPFDFDSTALQMWTGGKHVSAGILTVYILSTLAGGFVAGKWQGSRKFVWGLGIGVLYFLLLVLISFGIYHSIQEPFPQLLIVCILCTGGGMIGGMIS